MKPTADHNDHLGEMKPQHLPIFKHFEDGYYGKESQNVVKPGGPEVAMSLFMARAMNIECNRRSPDMS